MKRMESITRMVSEHAGITEEQSHRAIEAMLACIVARCGEHGKEVNKEVRNSNGTWGGRGTRILVAAYREQFGPVPGELKITTAKLN